MRITIAYLSVHQLLTFHTFHAEKHTLVELFKEPVTLSKYASDCYFLQLPVSSDMMHRHKAT